MLGFVFLILCYMGANVWLAYKAISYFSFLPKWGRWLIVVGFIFFTFAMPLMILGRSFHVPLFLWEHPYYWLSTGWMVFVLYMVLLLLLGDLLHRFIIRIPHRFPMALGLTALILIVGHVHFRNPVVQTLSLDLTKPATEGRMRVVAVSDVHLGYGITKKRLQEFVVQINEQKPDVVLISGDLIDAIVDPLREHHMEEELARINAPLGIYMALGNHEYISGIEESLDFIATTPIHLLRDQIVLLPNGVQIVGRDDRTNTNRKSLPELLQAVDHSKPIFLLDHQPEDQEVAEAIASQVDFAFYGHTHNGQVWPGNWLIKNLFKYGYGYYQEGITHIYTSSGLGLWGPPFRVGTESELLVVDFSL